MKFLLPYPPTINHMYGQRGKYRFIKKAGLDFIDAVQKAVIEAGSPKYAPTDRLCLVIDVYVPDRRKRDLDNLIKPVQDALQKAGVIPDDSQIDRIVAHRHPQRLGRCTATLYIREPVECCDGKMIQILDDPHNVPGRPATSIKLDNVLGEEKRP